MKLRVLGSCAGGGLPQWNCGGANSTRARRGDPDLPARTQPSVAVSADGRRWTLLNASPDVRQQLAGFPALHPREGTRDLPLDGVVLTSAELDHALGLLVMREALSYRILSTGWVRHALLEHNATFRLLQPSWGTVALDTPIALDRDGALEARLFPVSPKLPPFLRDVAKPSPETTVGVRVTERSSGARLVFAPGLGRLDSATLAELAAADLRIVDGTFFTADELAVIRPGAPDAFAMGHVPITGPESSLASLAELPGRSFYIHMNNTNPVLDLASPERARVERLGVGICEDGMELELSSDLEARLRAIGAERYHHRHPFNLRMHEGSLSPEEIRTWVANRYYYQTRIPVKDGLILAKAPDPGFRREWIGRIHDHDGTAEREGGLELWLTLADAVGLSRERVASLRDVLPGVRRACDAYVAFVESHDLLESVSASLTELFAGDIMTARIAAFEKHYPWVDTEGLRYFRSRTRQAPADARFGLAFVLEHAQSGEDRDRCAAALERKCEILWSLLDAVEHAHARPALRPEAQARLEDAEPMVVLPERAVALRGGGPEIVALCDGRRSAREIASELAARHPGSPGLADEVHDFIDELVGAGVLDR